MGAKKTRLLRIHGDNIVECERALKMIAEAFHSTAVLQNSPIYFPRYVIQASDCEFEIELLSGHGRWSGIDLGEIIHKAGGKLRESADAYLTEIVGGREIMLMAIEYCSALPAGNNAWQRNGRALASVLANVPYLYFAEIGGVELDSNRLPKSPRYPNPAVPFSYVALSLDMGTVCLPVYRAHPSITQQNYNVYKSALGYNESLVFIRRTINREDTTDIVVSLKEKAIRMVEILSNRRKQKDTLQGIEWQQLLYSVSRSSWLIENYKKEWKKKSSGVVQVSDTFEKLKSTIKELPAVPVAARDLPLCILPKDKIPVLDKWLKETYNGIDARIDADKDLAIVWITGFKPKGDDSRPDRGLSPFCRMILGKGINIMAVVSGPGKKNTWNQLINSPEGLCESNGLFQSIFECCNFLFVDSATCDRKVFIKTGASLEKNDNIITFPYVQNPVVDFFENDIDCGIHQILSNHKELGLYECFCNPPGGDWSGISFFRNNKEYKWTSLPRVSGLSKRPDHIFQIERNGKIVFVPIESKGYGKELEKYIGNRLKDYINNLFNSKPTALKADDNSEWSYCNETIGSVQYDIISVAAFLYRSVAELPKQLIRGNLDAVFAFEFGSISTLHFCANAKGNILLDYLNAISLEQRGFVVKVHCL